MSRYTLWSTTVLIVGLPLATATISPSWADDTAPKIQPQDAERDAVAVQDSTALSDEIITLAAENELLASDALRGHHIRVIVDDGIVTLSGEVPSLLAEEIAVGLVQRVRGVMTIVDQIEVERSTQEDASLRLDAAAALAADPATHKSSVVVTVQDGVATLTGAVATYGMKVLVENVVSAVHGIMEVQNQITTAPHDQLSDEELRQEVTELLQNSVQLDQIQLTTVVTDGRVVLNGTVTSSFQRSCAEQLAWRAGAKDVDVRGVVIDWQHANPELRTTRYEKATDEQIQKAVSRALRYDPRVLSFAPTVTVNKGVVTLSGIVSQIAASRAAERAARFTVGVHAVQNNLKVEWPLETPSDEQIAEYTLAAIHRDPWLNDEEIIVDCENAHIELHGIVENEFEKGHAEWTAISQKAVVHVDNYLTVRATWVPKSDEQIAAALKDQLDLMFVNDAENVVSSKVVDGVAIIEGSVETWYLWQAVMDAAVSAGAREPHMMLQVQHGTPASLRYAGPHSYIAR